MDGVNESDENGKISKLLDPDAKNKPLDESRKTGQTSRTKKDVLLKYKTLHVINL
ncbi:hypothetical protein Hanom_Chr08g00732611 [Helianthus anomalus]